MLNKINTNADRWAALNLKTQKIMKASRTFVGLWLIRGITSLPYSTKKSLLVDKITVWIER